MTIVFNEMECDVETHSLRTKPELMAGKVYHLPDFLRDWPWQRIISPHYRTVKAKSVPWIEGFKPFSPPAQDAFNKCDLSTSLSTHSKYAPKDLS